MESIYSFALLLKLPPSGLLKLARDISKNNNLYSICNMTAANRLELYLFLYQCAIIERKYQPLKCA